MSPRRWVGVLDLLDQADKVLLELSQMFAEPCDPILWRKARTWCANARGIVQAARHALERSGQETST